MDNPVAVLALGFVILFVVVLNLGLIAALRRKPGEPEDAWIRATRVMTSAGREVGDQNNANVDELHRRVAELRKEHNLPATPGGGTADGRS